MGLCSLLDPGGLTIVTELVPGHAALGGRHLGGGYIREVQAGLPSGLGLVALKELVGRGPPLGRILGLDDRGGHDIHVGRRRVRASEGRLRERLGVGGDSAGLGPLQLSGRRAGGRHSDGRAHRAGGRRSRGGLLLLPELVLLGKGREGGQLLLGEGLPPGGDRLAPLAEAGLGHLRDYPLLGGVGHLVEEECGACPLDLVGLGGLGATRGRLGGLEGLDPLLVLLGHGREGGQLLRGEGLPPGGDRLAPVAEGGLGHLREDPLLDGLVHLVEHVGGASAHGLRLLRLLRLRIVRDLRLDDEGLPLLHGSLHPGRPCVIVKALPEGPHALVEGGGPRLVGVRRAVVGLDGVVALPELVGRAGPLQRLGGLGRGDRVDGRVEHGEDGVGLAVARLLQLASEGSAKGGGESLGHVGERWNRSSRV